MRIRKISAVLLIILSIFTLVACNADVKASTPVKVDDGSIASMLKEDYGTREALKNELTLYSIYNDYERSDSSIKTDIVSYLDAFHGPEDNTKGLSDGRNINLVLMDSFPVTEDGSIRLEVYDIMDQDSGNSCFIIIPTDRRIADFLYLSDGGSWEQAKEIEIIRLMLNSMILYSRDVMQLADSLDAEQNMTKSITLDSHKTEIKVNKKEIETVNWAQNNSFNDAIEHYYHHDYLVGCGAVAVATVMAHWQYPASFIDIDFAGPDNTATLSVLKSRWLALSSWNGVYDWNKIVSGENPNQRAALLLDVADACSSDYGLEGTGTSYNSYAVCLNHFGYTYKKLTNAYDNIDHMFEVIASVENNMPVLSSGYVGTSGHTFVIDGAELTTVYRMRYEIDADSFSAEKLTESQIIKYHANLGWGGPENAWYLPDAVSESYGFPCEFLYINIAPANL